jgi:phosphate acyltransferase
MNIAVDAMGGDYAPHEIVKGALKAAQEYKVGITLIGKKEILHVLTAKHKKGLDITVVDAQDVIEDEESPIEAATKKPNASIPVGVRLVAEGKSQGFISAGSTGAVFFCSYMILGKIEGVERPAIGSVINLNPTSPFLLIDCGANPNCKPRHLLQFAQMGNIYAREIFGVASPRIALLNNGEEEKKGNTLAKDTYPVLKNSGLNFVGNIEGQYLSRGKADVIVTDGFTGNIVLKTLEGMGDSFLRLRAVGQLFSHDESRDEQYEASVSSYLKHLDFQESGGASLLGLNGNVIISHGRSKAKAIKNAIATAKRSAEHDVTKMIQQVDFSNPSDQAAQATDNGEA